MRLKGERLLGPQIDEFRHALRDAFHDEQEFKEFLLIQFNKLLEDFTAKAAFPTEILHVIQVADTEDWTEELLRAARLWRPTNTKLLTFAQQFGLAPSISLEPELERVFESMVRPNSKVFDPAILREHQAQIEGQICRIEVHGKENIFGTGFLVGPDVVITNYHVVESILSRGENATKYISFLFDFKKTIDTSLPGITHYLAERDWCIDDSKYSLLLIMLPIRGIKSLMKINWTTFLCAYPLEWVRSE